MSPGRVLTKKTVALIRDALELSRRGASPATATNRARAFGDNLTKWGRASR